MQDIISSEKRTIRNVSMERTATQSSEEKNDSSVPTKDAFQYSLPPKPLGRRNRFNNKWIMWGGLGLLAILLILIVASSAFGGARVTVTPRSALVNIDMTAAAYANPAPGELGYTAVTVVKEAGRQVEATGQEQIEKAASGRIIIYNNHDDQSQRLIKNTRFQTPDGLIFRIRDSVTVPGQAKNAAGETIPGSVEAEVFADSAGEEYNIGLTDFTVPAFKEANDPRFGTFYARSKTPMTGGFAGVVQSASEADTQNAQEEIKKELAQMLAGEVKASVPEGFLLVSENPQITYEELANISGESSNTVQIRMKGTVETLAVQEGTLAAFAASSLVSDYNGEEVRFLRPDEISIMRSDNTVLGTSTDSNTLSLDIEGNSTIVWTYDIEQLREDLAGKSKRIALSVFENYPGIEKADIVLRPFWKRSLPKDPSDIEVQEDSIIDSQ